MCSYSEFKNISKKKSNTTAAAKEKELAREKIADRVNE